MPGRHPQGKWIRDRAERIKEETEEQYGKEKGERVAYAVATQQAHAKGKSPKGYGTRKGREKAKRKHDEPGEMQDKAAMWSAYFDEATKIAVHPYLRTMGKSFLNPVATASRMFRKPKGLEQLKGMAQGGGEQARKARNALDRRFWHQASSLVGPGVMLAAPSYVVGRAIS